MSRNHVINADGLLLRMIEHAIQDLFSSMKANQLDAYHWLFRADGRSPMEFLWCCDILNVDPLAIRERLYSEKPSTIASLHLQSRDTRCQERPCESVQETAKMISVSI